MDNEYSVKLPDLVCLNHMTGICNRTSYDDFRKYLKESHNTDISEVINWIPVLENTQISKLDDIRSPKYVKAMASNTKLSKCNYVLEDITKAVCMLKEFYRYHIRFFVIPDTEYPLIIEPVSDLRDKLYVFVCGV